MGGDAAIDRLLLAVGRIEKKLDETMLQLARVERDLGRLSQHEAWVDRLRRRMHDAHIVREDDRVDLLTIMGCMVTMRVQARLEDGDGTRRLRGDSE